MKTVGLSALVTAAVTVAATATFTSLGSWAVDGVSGAFGGDDETPDRAAVLEMKRVSDPSGALTLTVPESWGFHRGEQNIPFGATIDRDQGRNNYAGTAFVSGTSPGMSDENDLFEPDIYVAASRDAADDLGVVGATPDELQTWAQGLVRVLDWGTIDDCTLLGDQAPQVAGYVTSGRLWRDCNGFDGTYRWDVAAASDDGTVVMLLQLQFSDENLPMDSADAVMSSITVAPEKLPEPTSLGEGGPPHPTF